MNRITAPRARAELKTLHRQLGTTTIHVTHDQQEALAVADVIAVMRQGAVEQVGAPLDLFNHPDTVFVAAFVGDPPMSLIDGTITSSDGAIALTIAGIVLAAPAPMHDSLAHARAPAIQVGLRPHRVAHIDPSTPGAIAASVYSREVVGRETQLMLQIGDAMVRYRTSRRETFPVATTLAVSIDLDGARLFDRASGRAITGATGA